MQNFDIKTTLNIYPTAYQAHTMTYITKGSSAVLNFDFNKEIYSFDDADQITFILGQGKNIYWFKMFTYLIKTSDTEPIAGKTYYTNLTPVKAGGLQCTATKVEKPNNPKESGYFEEVDTPYGRKNTNFILDTHFNHSIGDGFDYVSLTLTSEETAKFIPTLPNSEMSFEVAIRLDTDGLIGFGSADSIIIERQHPVAVLDSLYSKLI